MVTLRRAGRVHHAQNRTGSRRAEGPLRLPVQFGPAARGGSARALGGLSRRLANHVPAADSCRSGYRFNTANAERSGGWATGGGGER